MLIDTSGFFAVYSEKDKNHVTAKEAYQNSRLRLTTNYILAEYVALADREHNQRNPRRNYGHRREYALRNQR